MSALKKAVSPRQIAYEVFRGTRNRWPVELQKYIGPPGWALHQDLVRHTGNASLLVESSAVQAVFSWFSWRAVTQLEQRCDLSRGLAGFELPRLQMTSSIDLLNRKFSRDFETKAPRDWVDCNSDLIVIWIEPGAQKNDGATAGIIDVINWCETLHVPLWLAGQARWKYGPKHALHHERIDQWLEGVRSFDLTGA